MAQYIKEANIFGRIGSGLGQGLAEQIPQEIERNRLTTGLRNFEQDAGGLSPIQQLSRLAAIPGITPQMLQSFSELAKQQNLGNAYKRAGGQGGRESPSPKASANLGEVEAAKVMQNAARSQSPMQQPFQPAMGAQAQQAQAQQPQQPQQQLQPQQQISPQGGVPAQQLPQGNQQGINVVDPGLYGHPQINDVNPGDTESLPGVPWTNEQIDESVKEDLALGFTPEQAYQRALEKERRSLGQSAAHKERATEKEARQLKAQETLKRRVEMKLQKRGDEIFNDISGNAYTRLERAMEKELIENPRASYEDVADRFSEKALEIANVKNDLRKLGATTGTEAFFTTDKVLTKLSANQKVFKKLGLQDEYQKMLISDLGLSPQGSALIAYPPSKGIKEVVSKYTPPKKSWGRFGPMPPSAQAISENSKKAAIDTLKNITPDDSLLSISRAYSDKYPEFDQREFFKEIIKDLDTSNLNARQQREVAEGEKNLVPNWADIRTFPWLRGDKK